MDNRSNKFVFVPFCLMCQAAQAQGIVKYDWKSSIKPIMNLIIENDINIIQMPCVESEFDNFNNFVREPKGLKSYDTLEYNNHCEEIANKVSNQIKIISDSGGEILAILGIENSPSCAMNYIYTRKGMLKRKGIFMEKLYQKLEEYDMNIPMIGINRRFVNKSLKELDKIIIK